MSTMRGKALVALAAMAVSALTMVAPAAAHTTVYPTAIDMQSDVLNGSSDDGYLAAASGFLTSTKHNCLARRTINFYTSSGGTQTLRDVDLSSLNAAWAVRAVTPSPQDGFTVKVTRKRVDRRLGPHRRHICGGAAVSFVF